MAAPVVQSLEDVIKQIQTAYKPQQDQLDSLVAQNETSATGQIQGLDAAKTQAFNGIAQAATNKGMTFSGFTPNEQATYTGATYLPALAKLQDTITSTRNSLFGKKADLVTTGNLQANDVHSGQVSALQAYNDAQEKLAQQLAAEERQRAFTAAESAKDRALSAQNNIRSTAGSSSSTALTPAQIKMAVAQNVVSNFQGLKGRDGYVSNETWANGLNDWTAAGGTPRTFFQNYGSFVNPKYKTSYAGWVNR